MVAPQNRDQANNKFNPILKIINRLRLEKKLEKAFFLDRSRETLGQVAYPKKTVARFIRF